MADQPLTKHSAADGSTYWLDMQSPGDEYGAQYRVELVRGSRDVSNQEREQRLTLGAYNSWGEADEHRGEVELELNQRGIEALGDAAQQVAARPYTGLSPEVAEVAPQELTEMSNANNRLALPVTLDEHLTPVDREGRYVPHHLDTDGTAHWFSIVDSLTDADQPYQLRYFRAVRDDDGGVIHDSYPVMPMADTEHSPWPIPELNFYLEEGDLEAAQDLSQRVAQAHHLPFPNPLDLPELTPEARYYFGYGLGEDGSPSLEAVKTWPEGSERRFSTFTLATYGTFDGAALDLQELESIQAAKGLEAAMNVAESMAVASGFLHDQRDDPHVFTAGPPDPFTTERERTLEEEMNSDQPQEAAYTVEAISANNQARLEAWKTWGEGEDQRDRLLIPQPDWETARANAEAAHEMMQIGDLQNTMNLVELAAIEQGALDSNRDDPRLFTQGPPDPFTTIRQRELARERGELPDVTRDGHRTTLPGDNRNGSINLSGDVPAVCWGYGAPAGSQCYSDRHSLV
jgi:hypothetical protein